MDIITALLHDSKPVFSLSTPIASTSAFRDPRRATLPGPLLSVINGGTPQDTRFMNIMLSISDLNALAALFRSELATTGDGMWDDEARIGMLVNPVTHRLLNQASVNEPLTRWDTFSEALRLGAMIWIIQVKRRCRSYPATAEAHISTLLKILSRKPNAKDVWDSPDRRIIHLWLLVLCSASGPSDADLQISTELIANRLKESEPVSWAETMADVRQMPWVDILELPCAKLGQRLLEDNLSGLN